MPFSQTSQLSPIISWVEQLKPKSVLDVGIGMGQYGFLLRTKLEGLNLFRTEGTRGWLTPREDWAVRIDGIEGCAGYLTPVQEWSYNHVFVADALAALARIPDASYELVLAIDIVEHFEKDDALRFLAELRRVSSRAALVSTPKDFYEQHVEANPLEDHRSHWDESELRAAGYSEVIPNPESWIVVWTATN
ncbi:MAG: class I SAM-dependent methyltransferase [Pseudohongiellaceae bacterium]